MAVSSIYRLLKFAGARRVLFLVDRRTLAKQTLDEFQQFQAPDDGRLFTQLYNVHRMSSNHLDLVSRVCIGTIQRVYSMLCGGAEPDEELEERSIFDVAPADEQPKEVVYNKKIDQLVPKALKTYKGCPAKRTKTRLYLCPPGQ